MYTHLNICYSHTVCTVLETRVDSFGAFAMYIIWKTLWEGVWSSLPQPPNQINLSSLRMCFEMQEYCKLPKGVGWEGLRVWFPSKWAYIDAIRLSVGRCYGNLYQVVSSWSQWQKAFGHRNQCAQLLTMQEVCHSRLRKINLNLWVLNWYVYIYIHIHTYIHMYIHT